MRDWIADQYRYHMNQSLLLTVTLVGDGDIHIRESCILWSWDYPLSCQFLDIFSVPLFHWITKILEWVKTNNYLTQPPRLPR